MNCPASRAHCDVRIMRHAATELERKRRRASRALRGACSVGAEPNRKSQALGGARGTTLRGPAERNRS